MMEIRTCTKCRETKPMTVEYFHRDSSTETGFRPDCKVCRREHADKKAEEYQKLNKEMQEEGLVQKLMCGVCGEVKEETEFHVDNTKYTGRNSRCKECAKEYQRRYREAKKK